MCLPNKVKLALDYLLLFEYQRYVPGYSRCIKSYDELKINIEDAR